MERVTAEEWSRRDYDPVPVRQPLALCILGALGYLVAALVYVAEGETVAPFLRAVLPVTVGGLSTLAIMIGAVWGAIVAAHNSIARWEAERRR